MLPRIPAPVITMTRTGPSAASIRPGPGGSYHLQVTIGGNHEPFTVSTDGAIQQT
jgi:hypothetical protein